MIGDVLVPSGGRGEGLEVRSRTDRMCRKKTWGELGW